MIAPGLRKLLTAASRHEPRVRLLWALGAAALLMTARYVGPDPALIVLILDPELLALMVLVALALLRGDALSLLGRVGMLASHPRAAVRASTPVRCPRPRGGRRCR